MLTNDPKITIWQLHLTEMDAENIQISRKKCLVNQVEPIVINKEKNNDLCYLQ